VIELLERDVQLMPGVQEMLMVLQQANIKRCVVTHSPKALVDTIRQQHPILNTIPYWITREDYIHPKPHPEGYQLAISRYATPSDKIIGFEDTWRGIQALLQTRAFPVLIQGFSPWTAPQEFNHSRCVVRPSFVDLNFEKSLRSCK